MSKFKLMKCSQCGCTGVHACMGKPSTETLDINKLSKYNSIEDAIEHIRRSEAEYRLKRREERKNGNDRNSS